MTLWADLTICFKWYNWLLTWRWSTSHITIICSRTLILDSSNYSGITHNKAYFIYRKEQDKKWKIYTRFVYAKSFFRCWEYIICHKITFIYRSNYILAEYGKTMIALNSILCGPTPLFFLINCIKKTLNIVFSYILWCSQTYTSDH